MYHKQNFCEALNELKKVNRYNPPLRMAFVTRLTFLCEEGKKISNKSLWSPGIDKGSFNFGKERDEAVLSLQISFTACHGKISQTLN